MVNSINTLLIGSILLLVPGLSWAFAKGIYLTEPTVSLSSRTNYFIQEAKRVGIDTFVIDVDYKNKLYAKSIQVINKAGIKYVARLEIFPGGATTSQLADKSIWQKRMKLIEYAIGLGAKEIQLDYIRYNTKVHPSPDNAKQVNKVISWFKDQIGGRVPLQIDVFGETSFGPSYHIGQDVKVFAPTVNAINPMVYPSHFEPASYHSKRPYETVFESLTAMKEQFNNKTPFRLHAYIEVSNYRYRMSYNEKIQYFREQMRATKDAGADGWYAWSPTNKYRSLFDAMSVK